MCDCFYFVALFPWLVYQHWDFIFETQVLVSFPFLFSQFLPLTKSLLSIKSLFLSCFFPPFSLPHLILRCVCRRSVAERTKERGISPRYENFLVWIENCSGGGGGGRRRVMKLRKEKGKDGVGKSMKNGKMITFESYLFEISIYIFLSKPPGPPFPHLTTIPPSHPLQSRPKKHSTASLPYRDPPLKKAIAK